MHRKYKISQLNIKDAFRCIDKAGKGYATIDDYYSFFEEYYHEDIPLAKEEIDYLFHRHDKEGGYTIQGKGKRGTGRVTEPIFLKELMPLEDYILCD